MDVRFKITEYVVEATDFERSHLKMTYGDRVDTWKYDDFGITTTLAMIGEKNQEKRPINISCRWARINGVYVLFWHACSQLVDYRLIEDWFKKNCYPYEEDSTRVAKCDPDNFYQCISYTHRKKARSTVIKEEENDLILPTSVD